MTAAPSASVYKRKKWLEFRELCFNASGRACERCGKTQRETSLQVHHPYYEAGRKPWEYDPKFCEILCKYCHAKEHSKIKPDTGWMLIHSDWDEGAPSGPTHCQHCDASMEWHNDLWHPDWGIITVGYDCAEKLGNFEVHKIKKQRERMNTFVFSPRWRKTPKGWKYSHGGKSVFVLEKHSGYHLNINEMWGSITYKTIESAKQQAFRVLDSKFRKHSIP